MNIAIITGASSGMGEEFTKRLVADIGKYTFPSIDEIWLVARSEKKLNELVSSLPSDKLRAVPLDLTDRAALSAFSEKLQQVDPGISLLINCAGMGKSGAFATQTLSDVDMTLDLNCTSLTELTHICLPYMKKLGATLPKRKGPCIMNIASSAGFLPQPNFALYAASKAMVISLSRAINQELASSNISVTCICPGPCDTNFIKVSKNDPQATFTGFKAKFVTSVEKLIPASLKATSARKSMLVFGMGQKALHLASKIVPTNVILFFERKML
ncbi:MAG: SDR family NAD(P)-dependent oxidoreductase [Clostridiales bacterium]|nr:SDR family NAD(P)-dependent oxidoreductase [Clostridiales bacterium]